MVTLKNSRPTEDEDSLLHSIRELLQRHAAMNAAQIADYFSMDIESIRHGLLQLARTPEVEILRPVGAPSKEEEHWNDEADYFRWRKKEDRQYLWQIALRHKPILPAGRLYDLTQA